MSKLLNTVVASPDSLFGTLSLDQFLDQYWQKRPLLIRKAIPSLQTDGPPCSIAEVFKLATKEGLRSRLISREKSGKSARNATKWAVQHGPFSAERPLPVDQKKAPWTVLVQGVDQHHRGARNLLNQFRFIPDARLDDLMISVATDGGGVGPHADSYDVFLLQAFGQRQWCLQKPQKVERLVPKQPIKLLAGFEAESNAVLDPGDMLYVPPGWGHDGIAIGHCMTYSIGFRATDKNQLQQAWLDALAEGLAEGLEENDRRPTLYRDAGAGFWAQSKTPARVPTEMQGELQQWLVDALTRGPAGVPSEQQQFVGRWLSSPRADAQFPKRKSFASLETWWLKAYSKGIELSLSSRMLYDGIAVYLNGESVRCAGADKRHLERLANQRHLSAAQCHALSSEKFLPLREQLHDWASVGWIGLQI